MHAQYSANGEQRIRIEGNTDARGSSGTHSGVQFQRRSVAVAQQLVNRGVNGAQIEAVSFGKERQSLKVGLKKLTLKTVARTLADYPLRPKDIQ
ncbi:Peptidoglycan-associated lipoprotein [Oligella ureolytica]